MFSHSRSTWEANVDLINKHNLEADIGLHTYTLGMNKYGDMVSFHYFSNEYLYWYIYIDQWRIQQTNEWFWYEFNG